MSKFKEGSFDRIPPTTDLQPELKLREQDKTKDANYTLNSIVI